jgi:hypothetical protein
MNDDILPGPPAPVRGRPFEPGQSGNPAGRPRGSRNTATIAAAALLAGEAEALTRKAVEMALAGDPLALRLCLERALPRCRERAVKFRLPRIAAARAEQTEGPSPQDVCRVMNAVTSALARGEVTPGEAATIAAVVDTFVRTIKTTKQQGFRSNLLQFLPVSDYDEDEFADDEDGEDYEDGDYDDADDCDP